MPIENFLNEINGEFGEGAVLLGNQVPNVRVIPTGIFPLDYATYGGITEGGVNILLGNESAGKTTQALRIIANAQRKYEDYEEPVYSVFVDCEGTFDPIWAGQLGVDLDRLVTAQPEVGEAVVDTMIAAIKEPSIKLLVLDSVPMLVSGKEANKSAFDETVAETARLMKKFLNAANVEQAKRRREGNPVTIILINSYRFKVGVMFGDPRTVPGGVLQKMQSRLTIEFKNVEEKEGKDDIDAATIESNKHEFKLIKFKGPKHLKKGEFTMIRVPDGDLSLGAIDDYKTVLTYGKKHGLITGGGQSWRIDGIERKFKNQDEMRAFFIDDHLEYLDLQAKIIGLRRQSYGLPALPPDRYLMRHYGEGLSLENGHAEAEELEDPEDEDEDASSSEE